MPKFDWSQVKGYREDMTAEEKIALLSEDGALPEQGPTVSKALFDKTSSELADAKKQLRAKQTDDEAKEAERQKEQAEMKAELESLRRDKALAGHKASFLALGYDEKLAARAAEAMTDGKTEDVFAAIGENLSALKQTLDRAALDGTPKPPASEGQQEGDSLRGYMGL